MKKCAFQLGVAGVTEICADETRTSLYEQWIQGRG